jgi:hypothetical protein
MIQPARQTGDSNFVRKFYFLLKLQNCNVIEVGAIPNPKIFFDENFFHSDSYSMAVALKSKKKQLIEFRQPLLIIAR